MFSKIVRKISKRNSTNDRPNRNETTNGLYNRLIVLISDYKDEKLLKSRERNMLSFLLDK